MVRKITSFKEATFFLASTGDQDRISRTMVFQLNFGLQSTSCGGKEALKQAIRAAEEQQTRCPKCGSDQCSTLGEVPLPLEEVIRYIVTQKDWMGSYQQWQAAGYPAGSGLVERAVVIVIIMRMKKLCMRWKQANATAVVASGVQRINADWEGAAA